MTTTSELRILPVEGGIVQEDDTLIVSLYGGPSNACGCVRFTYSDIAVLKRHSALLRRWQADETALELEATEKEICLRSSFGSKLVATDETEEVEQSGMPGEWGLRPKEDD